VGTLPGADAIALNRPSIPLTTPAPSATIQNSKPSAKKASSRLVIQEVSDDDEPTPSSIAHPAADVKVTPAQPAPAVTPTPAPKGPMKRVQIVEDEDDDTSVVLPAAAAGKQASASKEVASPGAVAIAKVPSGNTVSLSDREKERDAKALAATTSSPAKPKAKAEPRAGTEGIKSYLDFHRMWEINKSNLSLFFKAFDAIPPKALLPIIKVNLTPEETGTILEVVREFYLASDPARALATIELVMQVSRFDLNIMLLPEEHKPTIGAVFSGLAKANAAPARSNCLSSTIALEMPVAFKTGFLFPT
jgi:hypothetical protein